MVMAAGPGFNGTGYKEGYSSKVQGYLRAGEGKGLFKGTGIGVKGKRTGPKGERTGPKGIGIRYVVFGMWYSVFGMWYLVFGMWYGGKGQWKCVHLRALWQQSGNHRTFSPGP
jgi:hypothetical protein